jgi:hypothetical protein
VASLGIRRDVLVHMEQSWGVPDEGHVFTGGPGPLARLDVLVYRPPDPTGMTSFATVGMAVGTLPGDLAQGGGGRAELWCSRRGPLDAADEAAVATRLADLVLRPWATGEPVDWGHIVPLDHDFPTFPGCPAVFLSGPLTPGGSDYIETADGRVRIVHVVPITEAERERARDLPPLDTVTGLTGPADIFAPRPVELWDDTRGQPTPA